jgi:hypothetical protein
MIYKIILIWILQNFWIILKSEPLLDLSDFILNSWWNILNPISHTKLRIWIFQLLSFIFINLKFVKLIIFGDLCLNFQTIFSKISFSVYFQFISLLTIFKKIFLLIIFTLLRIQSIFFKQLFIYSGHLFLFS